MKLPNLKFHKKNGAINWLSLYWIWWIGIIMPISILSIFIDGELGDVLNTMWGYSFIPLFGFFALDILQFFQNSKKIDKIFNEEMSIMQEYGWSGDPKKVKRLEELRKLREKQKL